MTDDYVLLTRPLKDSLILKERLDLLGIKSLMSPVISIEPIPYEIEDLQNYDAVIITSKHSIPFLPRTLMKEKIPIYAIGTETSRALEEAGFLVFTTASGNSKSLKKAVDEVPAHKRLLYLGGKDVSKGFKECFFKGNHKVTHIALYKAIAQTELTAKTYSALASDHIAYVLFYSARCAKIFERICDAYGLTPHLSSIQALCFAPSVIQSLNKDKWKDVHLANDPRTSSMIKTLHALKNSGAKYNE